MEIEARPRRQAAGSRVAALLAALLLVAGAGTAKAQPYVREALRIPHPVAPGVELEAAMIRLAGTERRPLALLNHGSPRDPGARSGMTPFGLYAQAMEFARRGWAVALVLRRGYGESGGGWAEQYGPCDRPDYQGAGRRAADDLRVAATYLARRPDVDPTRVISVGVSAGGFASVALTADPPPGLVAAINFAGGRGSLHNDTICRADVLTEAFRAFGRRSRIPTLWVYAVNDRFFGPAAAGQFRDAFAAAGGSVSFVQAAAYGEDGHGLFSAGGIAIWSPLVDDFLRQQSLVFREAPVDLPARPPVTPPAQLSANGRAAFEAYLRAGPHKAFAYSTRTGGFAWRGGRRTADRAREEALAACQRGHREHCTVTVDDGEEAK